MVHFVPCSTLKSLYCTASGLADSDMMFGLHLGRKEPRVEERAHFLGRCVLPGPSGALSGEGHSGATDGVGDPRAMASDRIRCIRPAGTSRFDARPDELARVQRLAGRRRHGLACTFSPERVGARKWRSELHTHRSATSVQL